MNIRGIHVSHVMPRIGKEEIVAVLKKMCKDSMRYFDVRVEELIPELDEVQTAEAFWREAVLPADGVLTF